MTIASPFCDGNFRLLSSAMSRMRSNELIVWLHG